MKALFIDGMTSPKIIWNALAVPMINKYKLDATYCEWYNWNKYFFHDWDVVCSHSLGGDSSIRLCNALKEANRPQPKLLMTLAPRYQAFSSWLDWFLPISPVQNFTAPNKVTHNFYTLGPLPSSPMNGAVENVRVGLPYWHGTICAAPEVHLCFDKFMRGRT